MPNYLLFSVTGLGICWGLYRVFLKKEKLFVFNRFFLLFSLLLCLIAPILHIDYGISFDSRVAVDPVRFFDSGEILPDDPEKVAVATLTGPSNNYWDLIVFFYWMVCTLFFFRFSRNLLLLLLQIRNKSFNGYKGIKTVALKHRGSPYSFFDYLFIHPLDLVENKYLDMLVSHERAHSNQFHSIDILLLEVVGCFFWYNPFLWFYKKEVLENHEYLADEAVINAGANLEEYSAQIIKPGDKVVQPLLSGFSFIQTKNRLNMLHKKRSSGIQIALRAGLALAIFTAVLIISSFSPGNINEPIVVVVDAGHGGKDPGNRGKGQMEKEINLAVANQLRELGQPGEIEIILIREQDQFVSLNDRLKFLNEQKADLFLSIHSNASGDKNRSGAEVFFSTENKQWDISKNYSNLLATGLLPAVGKAELKTANFLVLKNSNIPAVLIELGFMTNPQEFELLQDPNYQKKLARGIYNGLLAIQESKVK
ncbi:N-acetylmuramoyl-L-alanine amidase [Antarcticibacterium flavum]|uniref:N-acetylmuramoyl-L-alanine amidase n=1 Tax=Antarcticibacterium flavum TaxID=2058175 RepID=A0A5B7WYW8_9FLAO|nr:MULTISPECIES: N-acetylmuramoyl-L-alanine amidase [Antarcticibacterium]MCM4158909.1 hypothetical protein [Antarcticibacterium sp. W02-3]QCY68165.1 N-acetylmuramoyl-L-alanine amidase [Antarcticibacterium flavum]